MEKNNTIIAKFRLRIVIALVVLTVVMVGTEFAIIYHYTTQNTFTNSINLSGRQRMLTFNIVLETNKLINDKNPISQPQTRTRLLQLSNTLNDVHERLEILSRDISPTFLFMNNGAPLELHGQVHDFLGYVKELANTPTEALTQNNLNYLKIQNMYTGLINTFDADTTVWQNHADGNISRRTQYGVIFSLTAFFLALLGLSFFIFRPMLRQLRNEINAFADLTDTLEDSIKSRTQSLESQTQKLLISQDALHKSEERFRDFAEAASDWFWETGPEHQFTYLSPRYLELMGIDPSMILGKTRKELMPSDLSYFDQKQLLSHLEDLEHHRPFKGFQYNAESFDIQNRIFRVSGIPFYDPDGTFLGYRGVGNDITEYIKDKNELQYTQDRLYNAIEIMEDGFVLFDAEDRLVICNQKYKEIYYEIADMLKPENSFSEIVRAATECGQILDAVEDKEKWATARVEKHQNPTGPFDQKLSNGNWIRVIERKTAEGGIVGLRIDVTKEKTEEEQLRKLSHVIEQSSNVVIITDVKGSIEYINPMFTKIFGFTQDEAIGNSPSIIKSDETPPELYEELWKTIKSGAEWQGEIKNRRYDGSLFWMHTFISPIKNADGIITHFASIQGDITQRKEMELRENVAKIQAQTANRTKSELLANMGHELRTPLNAIIGFSSMMGSELLGPLKDSYKNYSRDINSSGKHLLELIEDILDVSAIEDDTLELDEINLDVGKVIEATLPMINSRAFDKNIDVYINSKNDQLMFYADKRRFMQILLNLLSNAIKFTPPNGKVTLTSSFSDKGAYILTVTDTGVGMNKEELTKALSEFGQVNRGLNSKHEGTGLGLPLTKGLVELHGGNLGIESEAGKGTTVTISFPLERTISF